MYQITRDGFSFLGMGFTGKKAAEFKEQFITAFNTMEKTLIEGQGERRQIDINHSRRTNSPEGLDIRYILDPTKLVMKPNPAGIELVECHRYRYERYRVQRPSSDRFRAFKRIFA